MSILVEIIKEDIKVAKKYLVEKNIMSVNIISNRIMSNLLIAEDNEKILMMAGWILKEISEELITSKSSGEDSKYNNIAKIAEEFIDKLYDMITKKEYDVKGLWELYFNYENKIRLYLIPKPEDTVYTKKPEFTRKVNLMLIEHFLTNKELLLRENNNLIKGIINDLSRVINTHGAKDIDFIVHMVFKAFDKYYDYALYSELNFEGKIGDRDALNSKLIMFIEKFNKIKILIDNDNIEKIYKCSTDLISDLSLEYRKYFISYSNIYVSTIKKRVELSKEAKERIGNVIVKAFEE